MGTKKSNKGNKVKKEKEKAKSPSRTAKPGKSEVIKIYQAAHERCMKKNDKLKSELREAKKKIKLLEKAILKINNKIARSKLKAVAKKVATKKKTAGIKKEAVKAAPVKKVAGAAKASPDPATPPVDNLKLIEGIGPAIERHLKSVGINSFAVLGKTPARKIKAILLERGGSRYSVHDPSSWSRQAKLALAGKMEELKALQIELKAGKK